MQVNFLPKDSATSQKTRILSNTAARTLNHKYIIFLYGINTLVFVLETEYVFLRYELNFKPSFRLSSSFRSAVKESRDLDV
jgi:hypothetical protein